MGSTPAGGAVTGQPGGAQSNCTASQKADIAQDTKPYLHSVLSKRLHPTKHPPTSSSFSTACCEARGRCANTLKAVGGASFSMS